MNEWDHKSKRNKRKYEDSWGEIYTGKKESKKNTGKRKYKRHSRRHGNETRNSGSCDMVMKQEIVVVCDD